MAPLLDFTAIDMELANPKYGSVCSVALVRVRAGRIVTARHKLVRPPEHLDYFTALNTEIHGIGPSDLDAANAERFADVYPKMLRFIGEDILVAHGAPCDRAKVDQSCEQSGIDPAPLDWIDTLPVARRLLPELANHKLPTLCEHFGIALVNHHDATDDARAHAELFLALGAPNEPIRRKPRPRRPAA